LTAAGHRRLAVIRPDARLAGDLESVAGFAAGARQAAIQEVAHDGTVDGVVRGLRRLFAGSCAPTGLLIFHAIHYLTVLSWLHQQGYRVPRDISVICRDNEPFLEAMLPLPTRYAVPARRFARKASAVVAALVGGHASRVCSHRLTPALLRGQTVAAAPA
jgi:DNA-binding LacI/PurR family transcriptional regulator